MGWINNTSESFMEASIKVSPPATVSTLPFMGIDVDLWIQVLTFIYIVMVVGEKIWTFYKKWKNRNVESKQVASDDS